MINLTLNQLKRPALFNLVPKFGTKVEKNDINKGGLSTEEVDRNVTLPFELMREVEVSSSDTTTKIQYDAKIAIVGSDPVTLTLDKASYKGCVITITNRSTEQATIVLSEGNQKNIESKKSLVLEWDGTAWNDTALVVDSTVSEDSNKPVSSAAVYQKATEITESYTQAIAGETTARSEAITAVEQKVTEETNARTNADTALGTRIDEEVGDLDGLKTTAKSSAVAAINELYDTVQQGGGDSPVPTPTPDNAGLYDLKEYIDDPYIQKDDSWYDLIIDSNEKLAQWRDASSITGRVGPNRVKIKKGTWTCTGIYTPDHSPTSTPVQSSLIFSECVHAEPGAKLVLKGFTYGLFDAKVYLGDNTDTSSITVHNVQARYIRNLMLEIQPLIAYYGSYVYGMHNCSMHILPDYHLSVDNTALPVCQYLLCAPHYHNKYKDNSAAFISMSYLDANVHKLRMHVQDCVILCGVMTDIVSYSSITAEIPAYAFCMSGKEQPTLLSAKIAHDTHIAITITDNYTDILEAIVSGSNNDSSINFLTTYGIVPIVIIGMLTSIATYCTVSIEAKSYTTHNSDASRIFGHNVMPMILAFIPNSRHTYNENTAIFDHCSARIDLGGHGITFTGRQTTSAPTGQFANTLIGFGLLNSISVQNPTVITNCIATIYAANYTVPTFQPEDTPVDKTIGFSGLTNLFDCKAYIYGYNPMGHTDVKDNLHSVFGFVNCDNVTNCAAALRMCAAKPDSIGFTQCTGMFKCTANSKWLVTGEYKDNVHTPVSVLPFNTANCSATIGSYSADAAVASTATGGYNVDIGMI